MQLIVSAMENILKALIEDTHNQLGSDLLSIDGMDSLIARRHRRFDSVASATSWISDVSSCGMDRGWTQLTAADCSLLETAVAIEISWATAVEKSIRMECICDEKYIGAEESAKPSVEGNNALTSVFPSSILTCDLDSALQLTFPVDYVHQCGMWYVRGLNGVVMNP